MKYTLIILFVLTLAGCAGYKPSHSLLIGKGFTCYHPAESKIFDTYEYKCNDKVINSITYYPALRDWTILAGMNGYTLTIIHFTVDSEKELNLLLQDFNNKHKP